MILRSLRAATVHLPTLVAPVVLAGCAGERPLRDQHEPDLEFSRNPIVGFDTTFKSERSQRVIARMFLDPEVIEARLPVSDGWYVDGIELDFGRRAGITFEMRDARRASDPVIGRVDISVDEAPTRYLLAIHRSVTDASEAGSFLVYRVDGGCGRFIGSIDLTGALHDQDRCGLPLDDIDHLSEWFARSDDRVARTRKEELCIWSWNGSRSGMIALRKRRDIIPRIPGMGVIQGPGSGHEIWLEDNSVERWPHPVLALIVSCTPGGR